MLKMFMLFLFCLQVKKAGGLSFNSTCTLTKCNERMVQMILHEYSILIQIIKLRLGNLNDNKGHLILPLSAYEKLMVSASTITLYQKIVRIISQLNSSLG